MAIAFRSATRNTGASGGITLAAPSGISDGDILVAFVLAYNLSPDVTISGFTLANRTNLNGYQLATLWKRASSESGSYAVGASGSEWTEAILACYSGCVASGSPIDAASGGNTTGASTTASITTTTSGCTIVSALQVWYGGGDATKSITAPGLTFTERFRVYDSGDQITSQVSDAVQLSAGSVTVTSSTAPATADIVSHVAALIPAGVASPTATQSRFRWGVDDGSESAHTWEAAESTNISLAAGVSRLLRAQLDFSGDFASTAFTLRYQKNGTGGYVAVPVSAGGGANEVYIATSSNIASGGEATTARLTVPSGKSSAFTTGRRWDDENGTDSIDPAADYYTELEWSLATRAGLTGGDYYDFRVYAGSSALDTYSQTARWTVAAGTVSLMASDALGVQDDSMSTALRFRAVDDLAMLADGAVSSRTASRLISEAASITDGAQFVAIRNRIVVEAINAEDVAIASAQRARMTDDAAAVSDDAIITRALTRVAEDVAAVLDSLTYSLIGLVVYDLVSTDTIAPSDDTRQSRGWVRATQDDVALIDAYLSQVTSGFVIYDRTTSDAAMIVDDVRTQLARMRARDDGLMMTEEMAATIGRLRALSDATLTDDGVLTARISTRQLSDLIDPIDGHISRFLPAVMYDVRIRLGGFAPVTLGGYNPVTLGGYS